MKTLSEVVEELTHFEAELPAVEAHVVAEFIQRLERWRDDDSSARVLLQDLQALFAAAFFATHEKRALVSLSIARLHDSIEALVGMTMNERLSLLDLSERWDRTSPDERTVLYQKVLSEPPI